MATKCYKQTYNDGVAVLCREKDGNRTDFNARVNPTRAEDLAPLVRLCFGESSCRAEDVTFAQQEGFSLSRKIRTPLPRGVKVDTACLCLIGRMLYKVSSVDFDRAGNSMFLYLEEVRELAQ